MGSYHVWIVCSECSDTHWLNGTVEIFDGPEKITTLEAFFGAKPLPPKVTSLVESFDFCEKVKRAATQTRRAQAFLVPA